MDQGLMTEHRRQLEAAFRRMKIALSAAERNRAKEQLELLLTAHASAEAAMLDTTSGPTSAEDQTTVKAEIQALDQLQPLTREYFQKLEQIRNAVADHLDEVEASWSTDRRETLTTAEPAVLASRYRAEVDRYVGHYGSA